MDAAEVGRLAVAAKAKHGSKRSAAGAEDLLSALPVDVLVKILAFLNTPDAVKTGLLSTRLYRAWQLVPEIRMPFFPAPRTALRFRDALAAREVPLRRLHSPPPSRRAVRLPCFEGATSICVVGFLRLAVPPAGVFARLTELVLERIRFVRGPAAALGDAVSSERCPSLRRLEVVDTVGLTRLAIRSDSLVEVELHELRGLRELAVDAPELRELSVTSCFNEINGDPVVSIGAPELVSLNWDDMSSQENVNFLVGMPHIRFLGNLSFLVYADHEGSAHNRACLDLLEAYKAIQSVRLTLTCLMEINAYQNMMEDTKVLPDSTNLRLEVISNGHAFGAISFHVLKLCTGISKLALYFLDSFEAELREENESEVRNSCPSGCICNNQQSNWKTEEILLFRLQEIEIVEMEGSDHEVSFVERLFNWATALKKVTLIFHFSMTRIDAKKLCEKLESFSRPGVCLDFRVGVDTKSVKRKTYHHGNGRDRRKTGRADQLLPQAFDSHSQHCSRCWDACVIMVNRCAPRWLRIHSADKGVLASHCTELPNGIQNAYALTTVDNYDNEFKRGIYIEERKIIAFIRRRISFRFRILVVVLLSVVLVPKFFLLACFTALTFNVLPFLSLGFSAWRLIRRDYGDAGGDIVNSAKLNGALDIFYVLVLFQSLLVLYWCSLDVILTFIVEDVAVMTKRQWGDEKWSFKVVDMYRSETRNKLKKDGELPDNWNLITYGVGLLQSSASSTTAGGDDHLWGARVLSKLSDDKGAVSVVRQKLLSSKLSIQNLIGMIGRRGTGDDDMEKRERAATIVAHLASDLHITHFPDQTNDPKHGGHAAGSSCAGLVVRIAKKDLELRQEWMEARGQKRFSYESRGPKELVSQGLLIVEGLTRDQGNCAEIIKNQRLLSKITSPLSSHDFLSYIVRDDTMDMVAMLSKSLTVVSRLLTSNPGDGATRLHQELASNMEVVNNLMGVLGTGSKGAQQLHEPALEILTELAFGNYLKQQDFVNLFNALLNIAIAAEPNNAVAQAPNIAIVQVQQADTERATRLRGKASEALARLIPLRTARGILAKQDAIDLLTKVFDQILSKRRRTIAVCGCGSLRPFPPFTSMELSAGETAAKRKRHSSYTAAAAEDRISALPDDILVLILLRLDDAAAAGRASALSRRWRGLWTLLPELCFPADADPQRILAALSAHEADLRCLRVGTRGATPESVAAWIHDAAPRVSGSLIFWNRAPGANAGEGHEEEKGVFELPTLHRATAFSLDLGFLRLAVPPAGVFASLTDLALKRVRFNDPYDIGDVVSSPRCPRLRKLVVDDARGLLYLDIRSDSLIDVTLLDLHGLVVLDVAAPALRHLTVHGCFGRRKSIAKISAPQLEWLAWLDLFDPESVQLGATAKLQMLILRLLDYSHVLGMVLKYPHNIGNLQSLMEKLTVLPDLMVLNLVLINNGHSFGASVFHVLRMCTGLKAVRLDLDRLSTLLGMQAHFSCPLGCMCDEPSNWKTKEITLNCLEKVEIHGIRGADHEVKFLEQFFKWATVLETVSITFHYSTSERRARKVCQTLSSFSRPETHITFYMYHDVSQESWYLLTPDQEYGEDHISALPDDILLQFLLRLHGDAAAAGRTSVLSKRWRRVWKLLPELCFFGGTDLHRVRAAISAHDADLHSLFVEALDAAPESVAACLRVAAPRLSGRLYFHNGEPEWNADDEEEEQQERGAFELPCFDRTTFLDLTLGSLGLALPAAGVFARLTALVLESVCFRGPCELGDAVSSPRFPRLEKLSMEVSHLSLSGGGGAEEEEEEKEEEEDCVSALPDDILLQILPCLNDAAAAGRTSVLSKRWRHVWKLLPVLCFFRDADLHRVRGALSTHDADLDYLAVVTVDAAPESVAACLRVAAPRLSGMLSFANKDDDEEQQQQQESGAFELPCFDRATFLFLHQGSLGLALPAAGVFARLTKMILENVRFHGPCELGDVVSSPRCPHLERLFVNITRGLINLAIHSESLTGLRLEGVIGLRQLTVVAPALRDLAFDGRFAHRELVANISAPRLEALSWHHQDCVPIGEMTQLQALSNVYFHVYSQLPTVNRNVVRLLKQIRSTTALYMGLQYPPDIGDSHYLMQEIAVLPRITALDLRIISKGHAFGASVSHLLKMCIGLKVLKLLVLHDMEDKEIQPACPSGCICDEPSNWKTEEFTLNCLQKVKISGLKGVDHEVTFVKRLLNWATILKTMSITFNHFIMEVKAKELRQILSSFSRAETLMEFT
ncbi:hypothetical protein U9M48_011454 [Paspalum notatum var. saurae]|uniref:F-box domain-containing protein n=1 Tax=Paspalum notatum var. saurae TaxID=547442 RepID=A0AAQ3WHD6_PASNO